MQRLAHYIGGELLPPASGKFIEIIEPATGKAYALLPDGDGEDINAAVLSADKASPEWANTTVQRRAELLLRIAALIERDQEALSEAESKDTGKPLSLAKSVDIPRAIENFRFFASAVLQFSSECHPMGRDALNYTLRQPLGVVACISPWNLPLYLLTWKIAPALAAGNTVVAKPSELAPYTAYLLSQICIEAGLPKGVLNIVHGLGEKAGAALSQHSAVKAISFTGGTTTGAAIARVAAPAFKKLSLELGGKNPCIVCSDADLEKCLEMTLRSSFLNQGEICLATSRIFVEQGIYSKFKERFLAKTKELVIGDPLEMRTQQGALISKEHAEKVSSCIELSKKEGGTILCGGRRAALEGRCKDGYFIEPTVIEGLHQGTKTNREEIFGPVVTLNRFDSIEQVLSQANSSEYGLAATIWTKSLSSAHRIAHDIHAGIVWINCWMVRDLRTPFGGLKSSGVGREGGVEALRFFTEPKNVCVDLAEEL